MNFTSTISTGTPSANRIYTLPDASGIIALTSDIPDPLQLTTIGTSGPATLVGDVLNIPEYESDKTYVFIQAVPSVLWTITHNLNKFPSVSVVDTANTQVFTIADYIDANTLILTFSAAFAGKAYLN